MNTLTPASADRLLAEAAAKASTFSTEMRLQMHTVAAADTTEHQLEKLGALMTALDEAFDAWANAVQEWMPGGDNE